MKRSASRLLSILLICLLGLLPLQSVLAEVTVAGDQNEMPCHSGIDAFQSALMGEQSNNDCDHCETASNCNSHCAHSVLALLAGFLPHNNFDAQALTSRTRVEVNSQQPSTLFRPPRS